MIKAIIFDWHGVLDEVNLEGALKRASAESKIPLDELKNLLRDINKKYTLGDMEEGPYWKLVADTLKISEMQAKQLQDYINSVIQNKELWDYLPELKKKYKLAILSDCPIEKISSIRKKADLTLFDHVFFSAEVKLDKSMPEFFDLCANTLKLDKQEILFTDDNPKIIDFASTLGFKTHLFTNTAEF